MVLHRFRIHGEPGKILPAHTKAGNRRLREALTIASTFGAIEADHVEATPAAPHDIPHRPKLTVMWRQALHIGEILRRPRLNLKRESQRCGQPGYLLRSTPLPSPADLCQPNQECHNHSH